VLVLIRKWLRFRALSRQLALHELGEALRDAGDAPAGYSEFSSLTDD